MNCVLQELNWRDCIAYLEDIIVFGKIFEKHLQRLNMVLKRVANARLKIQLDKCEFAKQSVIYLGHLVSKNGI